MRKKKNEKVEKSVPDINEYTQQILDNRNANVVFVDGRAQYHKL